MKIQLVREDPLDVFKDRRTIGLLKAAAVYVSRDNEPDSYCPEDLDLFRRAFAGDDEAFNEIIKATGVQ